MVIAFATAPGVAMLTQTCDIVNHSPDKQHVQVALLKPAGQDDLDKVRRGERPQFGYLSTAAEGGYVVDFNTVATFHKQVVAGWHRKQGCANDRERREFASALARFRQRFAFPDAFNEMIKPLRKRIESKRNAESPVGRLVRAIVEIRVRCDNWDAPSSLLFSIVTKTRASTADRVDWEAELEHLARKTSHAGFPAPEFRVVTYDDISASEYIASDRLDFDGLSET